MNLAIIGSRSFDNYGFLKKEVKTFIEENFLEITRIISGGAKGADTLAEIYALEFDIPVTVIPALWDVHGKKAGYLRNVDIIENSDAVIAFWDGQSPGTQHSINIAKSKNKLLKIVYYEK